MSTRLLSEKDAGTKRFIPMQIQNGLLLQQTSEYLDFMSLKKNRNKHIAQGFRMVCRVAAVTAAGASSLVLNEYNNSSRRYNRGEVPNPREYSISDIRQLIESGKSRFSKHQQLEHQQLPHFIREPSPLQLAAWCMMYSVAVNGYYHLHRGDTYQIWFVVCGVAGAFVAGWACGKDAYGSLMDFAPWFLILSMVISSVVYWALRSVGWSGVSGVPDENP